MNQNMMLYNWKRKPSRTIGLKYIPTIEPEYSDSEQRMFTRTKDGFDLPLCIKSNISSYTSLIHNGPSVRKSHTDMISGAIASSTKTVLEIGINVYKPPLLSTTRAIISNKEDDCVYLGIDVNDDSSRRADVRAKMLELNMTTIDLLIIDGDHSIDLTLNDWCFAEFLSPNGVVIIHDTNVHIGPRSVFDAIDEMSFSKKLIGSKMKSGKFPNYGMGLARRLF
jgi:hypothetical protein